jgi:hypothetical protein
MHIVSPIEQEAARATISEDPTATHLTFQVEASGALTDKSVPQRTGLLVPRTNLQPKCISAVLRAHCWHLRTKFSRYSWQTELFVSTFLQPGEGTILTNCPDVYCSTLTNPTRPEVEVLVTTVRNTQPSVGPLTSLCTRSSKTLSEELTEKFLISRRFKIEGTNSFKYLSELTVPSTSISPIIPPVHTVLHNHRKKTVLSCPSLGLCEKLAI